jgi:hypothetical protein
MYEINLMKEDKKNKKNVTFDIFNEVLYVKYDKNFNYWLNEDDYINSKKTAMNEIYDLLSYNPKMTVKDAMMILYQPENIFYNTKKYIDFKLYLYVRKKIQKIY